MITISCRFAVFHHLCFPNLQENRGKRDSILQRLTHETELIVLSWRLCEQLSAIASYQWHRKQKDSKVSISIGAFNLKWQVSVSAIISKKLQWTPLINFVFWNSGLESSKYTSFVLIQRIDIWPFVILYCFFFPSVNFFLHSDFIESWKRCSQIKKKVCQQNAHWHVHNRINLFHLLFLLMPFMSITFIILSSTYRFLMPKDFRCKYTAMQLECGKLCCSADHSIIPWRTGNGSKGTELYERSCAF